MHTMKPNTRTDNPHNRMYVIPEHGKNIAIITDNAQQARFHSSDFRKVWNFLEVVFRDNYGMKRIPNKAIRFLTLSWHFEQASDIETLTNCPSGNTNEKSAGAMASFSDNSTMCCRPQKQHGTLFVSLSIAFNSVRRLITLKF